MKNAIELIKHFEGFRSRPYQLPGESFLTIGYGRTRAGANEITTPEKETAWLEDKIESLRQQIKALGIPLNDNQVESLISFAYNVGINALRNSTLVKRLRANDPNASSELLRWVKDSRGVELAGLKRRRIAEKRLFDTPIVSSVADPDSQPQSINLVQAAKYTTGLLPHQNQAWDYLQKNTDVNILSQFAKLYRNNPNLTVRPTPNNPTSRTETDYRVALILKRCKELGIRFKVPQTGYYAYVIGIEGCNVDMTPNSDEPDKWNDAIGVLKVYSDKRLELSKLYQGTTEPGSYYVKHRLNPKGAAFAEIDTMHKAIWMRGSHKSQQNCLVQIGAPITVVRDNDNSSGRSANDPIQKGYFGINLHHANDQYSKNTIGKWSAGCIVIPSKKQHQELMGLVNGAVNKKIIFVLLSRRDMN